MANTKALVLCNNLGAITSIKGKDGYLKITMRYQVIASGGVLVSKHHDYEKANKARDAYNKKTPKPTGFGL